MRDAATCKCALKLSFCIAFGDRSALRAMGVRVYFCNKLVVRLVSNESTRSVVSYRSSNNYISTMIGVSRRDSSARCDRWKVCRRKWSCDSSIKYLTEFYWSIEDSTISCRIDAWLGEFDSSATRSPNIDVPRLFFTHLYCHTLTGFTICSKNFFCNYNFAYELNINLSFNTLLYPQS